MADDIRQSHFGCKPNTHHAAMSLDMKSLDEDGPKRQKTTPGSNYVITVKFMSGYYTPSEEDEEWKGAQTAVGFISLYTTNSTSISTVQSVF